MSQNSDQNGNSRNGNTMHYCDQAEEKGPNRKLIFRLMADITCVLEKSFGENEVLQTRRDSFVEDMETSHEKLQRYQGLRDELDTKMQEQIRENQELNACFEEQCKVRCGLENCISQLKEHIQRQEELIACLNAEKVDLLGWAQELETDKENHKEQVASLHTQREGLTRGVQGFEVNRLRCGDLQGALAECCERCDSLLQENRQLIETTNGLHQNLEAVGSEKSDLLAELEHIRKMIQDEKDQLGGQICHLLEQQATFNQEKANICRSLNEAIREHHAELDRLQTEAAMYSDQLDKERKDKDDFTRRLREGDMSGPTGSDATGTGPCAELERQLAVANDKIQEFQDLYDKEASERKKLDKELMGLIKENTKLEARANVIESKKPKGKLGPGGGISSPPPRSPKTSIDRGTGTQGASKDPKDAKVGTGSPETETILGRKSNTTQHSQNPGIPLPTTTTYSYKALNDGEYKESTESVLTGQAPWGRRFTASKDHHDDHVHFTSEQGTSTSKDDSQSKKRGSKEVGEDRPEDWSPTHEGHSDYHWKERKSQDPSQLIALRDAMARKSKHHLDPEFQN